MQRECHFVFMWFSLQHKWHKVKDMEVINTTLTHVTMFWHSSSSESCVIRHICHDILIACECSTLYRRVTPAFDLIDVCLCYSEFLIFLHHKGTSCLVCRNVVMCSHEYSHTNIYAECLVYTREYTCMFYGSNFHKINIKIFFFSDLVKNKTKHNCKADINDSNWADFYYILLCNSP